jgi:DNA-binding MarR family transcriptional regulator
MTSADDISAPNQNSSPGPREEGSSLTPDLRIALSRCVRRIRAEKSVHELNDGQCSVLATLEQHGPLTSRELADHEGVRPPSMTRIVTALTELGLVRRADDPRDGRQILVQLTEDGSATLSQTRHRRHVWLDRHLAALSAEDRAVLVRATELLNRIADL